MTKSAKVN